MDRQISNDNNNDSNDNNVVRSISDVITVTEHKTESPLKDTSKFSLRKGKRFDQARLTSSLKESESTAEDAKRRTSSSENESSGEKDSKGIKRARITEHPAIQGKGKRKEKSVQRQLLKRDEFKKTSRKSKSKESDKVKSELTELLESESNESQSKKEMSSESERIEETKPIEYINQDREERKQRIASRQQSQRELLQRELRNSDNHQTPKNLSVENPQSQPALSEQFNAIPQTTFIPSNGTFYFGDNEGSEVKKYKRVPHLIKGRLLVKKHVLGEGVSCVVKRGLLIHGDGRKNEQVAVKIYKQDQDSQIHHDLKYLEFQHENLLQYKGFIFGKNKKPQLISELCHTNLRTYIEKKQFRCVYENQRKKWKRANIKIAHKIARGLHYIHSRNKIHCDVKPENILLRKSEDGTEYIPKLGDFGSITETSADHIEGYGTRDYRSPELWKCFLEAQKEQKNPLYKPEYKFDSKLDSYSFGMTCWSMFHPGDEIWNLSDRETREKVLGGERPEIEENSCPRRMEKLIRECWDQDPSKRPSSGEIVQYIERYYGKYL